MKEKMHIIIPAVIAAIMMITCAILFSGATSPVISTTSSLPRDNNEWDNNLPQSITPVWTVKNVDTFIDTPGAPVIVSNNTVSRIDSSTGQPVWNFSIRNSTICAAANLDGNVLVVYNKKNRGCSSYILLDGQSGASLRTAQYGTKDTQAAIVTSKNHAAVVYPQFVRAIRDDLVTTSEFGDNPYPTYGDDQHYQDCTISDVTLSADNYAVAAQCTNKNTGKREDNYNIKVNELSPEESTQAKEVMNIDSGSTSPVTLPIMTKAMIEFITAGSAPSLYNWEVTKDRELVSKEYVVPGSYGFPYQDFEGIGYVWRVGGTTMLRHGSEDLTNPYKLENTIGNASRSNNTLLVPTEKSVEAWNPISKQHHTIRADGMQGTSFGFSGNTFMALQDTTLTGFQPETTGGM